MGANKFNWRILKTLSNIAFIVLLFVEVLSWYHQSRLDESVIADPTLRGLWLSREHLYQRIVLISIVVMVIFRITYWIIEYIHDRRLITEQEGDRWQKDQGTSL